MWAYILRRLLYNVPVYLGILLLVMVALRVAGNPVNVFLGKNPSQAEIELLTKDMGLDRPFFEQYFAFLGEVFPVDRIFGGGEAAGWFPQKSWELKQPVGELIAESIGPSLSITIPALLLTSLISITIGLVSSYFRGRALDKTLVFLAVIGMSVSFLVYIIFGQYYGAFRLSEWTGTDTFAIQGYPTDGMTPAAWVHYCMLPVLINVVVAMGYDTRFYRSVMVEEGTRDYITTAIAKGATKRKVMFVHMLKNAMIPIITRIMITLPFLITGSILLEMFFNIPGMGRTLIKAIHSKDFPVIQSFTAIFAGVFILSNILTDVLYALVDPRVRLS